MNGWRTMLAGLATAALAAALLSASERGVASGPASAGAEPARASAGQPFVDPLFRQRAVVWAVGDGADGGAGGLGVAELIGSHRVHRFLYLGDVYQTGTAAEYGANYRPLFGRFDRVGAPTIGNHEYANRAVGYDPYWEEVHGRPPPRSYSFSAAGWQFLSLDSIGPMGEDSEQLAWLRRRLNRTPRFGNCRIAFTHLPRYSAGPHGDHAEMEPVWRTLRGRARLLVSGHDHHMERRFQVGGVIQLISGAGGISLRDADDADRGVAFLDDGRYGALRLRLSRRRALLSFVAVGGSMLDTKRVRCARGSR